MLRTIQQSLEDVPDQKSPDEALTWLADSLVENRIPFSEFVLVLATFKQHLDRLLVVRQVGIARVTIREFFQVRVSVLVGRGCDLSPP